MDKDMLQKLGFMLLACIALSACAAADRIAEIGQAPEMSKISNPVTQKDYQPVSLPMPSPKNTRPQRNSLWAADRTTFFKDQRASDVGDIITVTIDIDDEAKLDNETTRARASNEDSNLNSFLGVQNSLNKVLPEDINDAATGLINPDIVAFDSGSSHTGNGTVDRKEEVEIQLAAFITQILPNGNMVIHGRQEVLVNFEKRVLEIDGVIRPEDISVQNSVSAEKIAEARITYSGKGQITDMQQPRYGQQLYDIVFPF